MKKFYLLIVLSFFLNGLSAQTVHEVEVFNFGFEPSSLTIEVGDIVEWTNTEGFHNVDGNSEDFPANPEAFGNPLASAPWTFSYEFTMEGEYGYQCEAHSGLMQGTITVTASTSSTNDSQDSEIAIYPNPSNDFVQLSGLENLNGIITLRIFDITGKLAIETTIMPNQQIDVSNLNSGVYFFNVLESGKNAHSGKFSIE